MRTYRDVSDGEGGPFTVKPSGILGTFAVLGVQMRGGRIARFHGTQLECECVRDVLNFLGGYSGRSTGVTDRTDRVVGSRVSARVVAPR